MSIYKQPCYHCGELGFLTDETLPADVNAVADSIDCGYCDGNGYFLTKAGIDLLSFLKLRGISSDGVDSE
jgi:hypothetical protein